jgi:hypothetical protein
MLCKLSMEETSIASTEHGNGQEKIIKPNQGV